MQPSSEVAGQELVQRGMALFKAGAYTDAGAALEQAFGAFIRAERLVHAARVAIRLRQLYTTLDEPAAARGWEQRASRVLERIGPCVERGYLALSVTGCEVRDPCDLAAKAELALGLARQFGDHELELRALADKGLALIGLGQVDDGLALLDEVMVAVAAGEIANPEIRGTTICAMLAACERTGDAARAAYWSQKVENDRYLNEIPIVGTHCLMAQGAVESLLGRWSRAEERLRAAMQAGMTTAYHTASTVAYLAELRIQQGRLEDAAELLAGFEDRFEALPALARLRMAEGRPAEAAAHLRLVARSLGSDRIRLAPILCRLVEAELSRGRSAAAQEAAEQLHALAQDCSSTEIQALARLAGGRVALSNGRPEAASEELESALVLLARCERPLLTGEIRLALAEARRQTGETDAARGHAETALTTFTNLGALPSIERCRSLLKELQARQQQARACDNPARLSARELDVARLISRGMSNEEIAAALVLSVRTVERHVSTIYEKLGATGKPGRAAATAYVLKHGLT